MNAHRFRPMLSRQNLVPLTSAFLLLVVAVCGFVASRAQESPPDGEREVVEKIPKHLPIKVKVKKPERLKDAKNEEWLGELEVEVTNTGTKPIYFLYISLHLPDVVAPSGHSIGFPLQYGRTALIALDEPVQPDDVPLLPGGVVVLKVPENPVEAWRLRRARGESNNPKKVELIFRKLNFGDGTGFVGSTGKPLPEVKERGANVTCPGDDVNTVGVSAAYPPRSYIPDVAALAKYLPPPASLVPAFFFGNSVSPAPAARQTLCCTSPCLRLKDGTYHGCECPVGDIPRAREVSCSEPGGTCGSIRYEPLPCFVNGQTRFCEQSFVDPTCAAHTPEPTPTSCTPAEPQPDPCCTPESYRPDPNLSGSCRWNCRASETSCSGVTLADGCIVVSGPVVCEELYGENYRYTSRADYGSACCPTPTPTPTPGGGECGGAGAGCPDWEQIDGYVYDPCGCISPVLVDVRGDGFRLTGAAGGVRFDFDGDGRRGLISWTEAGSDDSWLVLDRDGDGVIDTGKELFGNLTPQPPSDSPNGFLALAEYDRPGQGGNNDGVIDGRDRVFASLPLWRDANHDGVSQPEELHALQSLDVARLHLDYKESKRTDEFGNRFRYRAKVDDAKGAKVSRWAWDVFLVAAP